MGCLCHSYFQRLRKLKEIFLDPLIMCELRKPFLFSRCTRKDEFRSRNTTENHPGQMDLCSRYTECGAKLSRVVDS